MFNTDRLEENHILALDENNNPIPHTYLGNIIESNLQLSDAELENIHVHEEGFLFYSNPHTCNFQHFLTELFPKLIDYLDTMEGLGRSIPLIVPDYILNKFINELLEVMNLKDSVEIIGSGVHFIKNLYSSSFVPNFHAAHPRLIRTFKLLHQRCLEKFPSSFTNTGTTTPPSRTYLGRDKAGSSEYNNTNTGVKRVILNEDLMCQMLEKHGFATTVLGTCSLAEKKQKLENKEIIISPIGANLMNLVFLTPPYPKLILIIYSSNFRAYDYFIDIFNQVYDRKISFGIFGGESTGPGDNSPFLVNIDQLEGFLADAINKCCG